MKFLNFKKKISINWVGKHFCDRFKIDLKDFKLNFAENSNYEDFKNQMEKNIEIGLNLENISSQKLLEKLKLEGIEKTQNEINLLEKFSNDNQKKSETLRYMDLDNFAAKYKEKLTDRKVKFMMPIGWGWAYPFVKYSSMGLIAIKTTLSVPWLPFFILCGICIRIIFLPMMIRQMVLIHRMSKVSPNIRLLASCTAKCNLSIAYKVYYFTKSLFKYCKDVKVNPFVFAAYNLFQLPVFFLMIMSIRKIAYEQDLKDCGILWFKNLNEPDPYMILPVISVCITYYNLGRGINKDNEHWFINRWRTLFQILQICYLPFTCQWPVASHIYWVTSTVLIFAQQTILRHPIIMSKINPTYYEDMQKVFHTERSKEDSERYIEKLKICEDTIIKSPTSTRKVLYEYDYEKTKMNLYLNNLRYRKKFKKRTNKLLKNFLMMIKNKKDKEKEKDNK